MRGFCRIVTDVREKEYTHHFRGCVYSFLFISEALSIFEYPPEHPDNRCRAGLEPSVGMLLNEIPEVICMFTKSFFGNHIAAEPVAEEIKILKVFSKAAEVLIRHHSPFFFVVRNR